ncbi:hypothetical protein PVAND_016914 [Polypedilum vanderplanki]|uniref:Uncharacterized protein n=1 Tax=Polypedilum vanderplanki TaxID=319348 RepID=A0A9J6BHK8_POLVA|nr:hypothetical protein PVAND_016914 [Polypedilum vanderplanki]
MKFAVVLAAIFVCAQSSAVLQYAAWPYAASWSAAPWAHAHAAWAPSAPITQYSSWPAAHLAYAPAASYAAHVPAAVVLLTHQLPKLLLLQFMVPHTQLPTRDQFILLHFQDTLPHKPASTWPQHQEHGKLTI